MEEQLQNALAVILNKATAGVEAGVSFLSGQLPDVIEQLLLWKFAEACLSIVLGILLLVPAAICLWGYMKKQVEVPRDPGESDYRYYRRQYVPTFFKDNDGDPQGWLVVAGPFALVASVIGVVGIVSYIAVAVQIWIAPKVYLIEYAAKLVGGK